MRISDWSSDVCSSDLRALLQFLCRFLVLGQDAVGIAGHNFRLTHHQIAGVKPVVSQFVEPRRRSCDRLRARIVRIIVGGHVRSEEHTSELQSLMRISYAVFCLKKKKYKYTLQCIT